MLSYLNLKQARKHAQGKQFIYRTLKSLADTNSFDTSCKKLLNTLGKSFNWHIGHLYQVKHDQLESSGCWYVKRSLKREYTQFIKLTEQIVFLAGESLPGESWLKAKTTWLSNIEDDKRLASLKQGNKNIPLKSGLAFPLFDRHGKVDKVVEFFSPLNKEEDKELIHLIDTFSLQASQILYRRKIEDQVKSS